MSFAKRCATAVLLGGLALAVVTPIYVAYAVPELSGALYRPGVLLVQAAPFVLCAVWWLPSPHPRAGTVALLIATLLLVAALVIHLPELADPGRRAGDMTGVQYTGASLVLTLGVLIISLAAVVVIWRQGRGRGASMGPSPT